MLGVLLQTRSVSLAAKRLGLSQPTVSRALNQLRTMLGDPLLVRSGGGMILTQRGVELARPLEEWMALTSTVLQPAVFAPRTLDRTFRLAATDYGVLSVISPALQTIGEAAPGCHIEVTSYSDDMFRQLASGEIDLIIYGFRPDESVVHSRLLFRETQSVIVRPGHPLATTTGDTPLTLDEFLRWPQVAISVGTTRYDHVDVCLGERKAERQVTVRLPYFYAAPDLIGTSDTILTMPTRAAIQFARQHGFVCLAAPEEIVDFDYWVFWHERSARDPATQWLIDKLSGDHVHGSTATDGKKST